MLVLHISLFFIWVFVQELEAMKKRLQQMEQETMAMDPADEAAGADGAGAAKAAGDNAENGAPDAGAPAGQDEAGPDGFPPSSPIDEATADSDARSIYVGNVRFITKFLSHPCVFKTLFIDN